MTLINQSINQPINQSTIQSINQSINQKKYPTEFKVEKKAYLYYIKIINIIVFCEVNPPKKTI